jgi:hypothetical protein
MRAILLAAALLLPMAGLPERADCDVGDHTHHDHDAHHHGRGADSAISGSVADTHVHQPGVRNHGTEWFFDQPWAARFVWGKMIRDAVILLALAGVILVLSGLYRRRWQR